MPTPQETLEAVHKTITSICEDNGVSMYGNDCGEVTLGKREGKQLVELNIFVAEKD